MVLAAAVHSHVKGNCRSSSSDVMSTRFGDNEGNCAHGR